MLSGHFVPTPKGNMFVTQFGELADRPVVLCVPPLFEEMNLSRAILAKQGQYFAAHGIACVIMDYLGTGDSEGHIEQQQAADWYRHLIVCIEWLKNHGASEIVLWGVRFGGLMLGHHINDLHAQLGLNKLLLWKPLLKGKQMMSQFLRLKSANQMMTGTEGKQDWRQTIVEGQTVEVAGYAISPGLYLSLEQMQFGTDIHDAVKIRWMEIGAKSITPVVQRLLDGCSGNDIDAVPAAAPAFWQIPEIFALPEHQAQTLAYVRELL